MTFDEACSGAHKIECKGDKIVHLAIIDYLQLWNINKIGERFIKVYLRNKNAEGLSAIEP